MKVVLFRCGRTGMAWATLSLAAVAITFEWLAKRAAQSSKFFTNKLPEAGE